MIPPSLPLATSATPLQSAPQPEPAPGRGTLEGFDAILAALAAALAAPAVAARPIEPAPVEPGVEAEAPPEEEPVPASSYARPSCAELPVALDAAPAEIAAKVPTDIGLAAVRAPRVAMGPLADLPPALLPAAPVSVPVPVPAYALAPAPAPSVAAAEAKPETTTLAPAPTRAPTVPPPSDSNVALLPPTTPTAPVQVTAHLPPETPAERSTAPVRREAARRDSPRHVADTRSALPPVALFTFAPASVTERALPAEQEAQPVAQEPLVPTLRAERAEETPARGAAQAEARVANEPSADASFTVSPRPELASVAAPAAQARSNANEPSAPSADVRASERALPERAVFLAEQGGGSARIQLRPPELGEVELMVRVRGRRVEVHVRAEEIGAQQTVLESRERLGDALAARDLRMEEFRVSLSGGASPDAGAFGRRGERGSPERDLGYPPAAGHADPDSQPRSARPVADSTRGIDLRV